mgnify:CR=1 FL=1
MKKHRYLLVLIVVLALMLAACTPNSAGAADTAGADSQANTTDASDSNATGGSSNAASGPIDMEQVFTDTMFLGREENVSFDYTLTDEEGTTTYVTIQYTPGFLRGDVATGTDEASVIVFNLSDNTAFMYMPSLDFAGEYTNFPLFESIQYQESMADYIDTLTNVKRDTLNGWDVIYGEAVTEEGPMQFWYSEEYGVMLKFIMDTETSGVLTYEVTRVEQPAAMDPSLFTKPEGMTFYDLGDASDMTPGEPSGQ